MPGSIVGACASQKQSLPVSPKSPRKRSYSMGAKGDETANERGGGAGGSHCRKASLVLKHLEHVDSVASMFTGIKDSPVPNISTPSPASDRPSYRPSYRPSDRPSYRRGSILALSPEPNQDANQSMCVETLDKAKGKGKVNNKDRVSPTILSPREHRVEASDHAKENKNERSELSLAPSDFIAPHQGCKRKDAEKNDSWQKFLNFQKILNKKGVIKQDQKKKDPYQLGRVMATAAEVVRSHDGRDKPAKLMIAVLSFFHNICRDLHWGGQVVLDGIGAAKDYFDTARLVAGLWNVFNDCLLDLYKAFKASVHHAKYAFVVKHIPKGEKKDYPCASARILGLIAQLFKVLEKSCFIVCFAICKPISFVDKCAKGQLGAIAKSMGNNFKYFWMGCHVSSFVSNLCDLIRTGLIMNDNPIKKENGQLETANEAHDSRMNECRKKVLKLVENILDIGIDVLVIASLVTLCHGYLIVAFCLATASIGLYTVIDKAKSEADKKYDFSVQT